VIVTSRPLDALALRRDLLTWIEDYAAAPAVRAVAGLALAEERAPMDPADDRGRALALARWVSRRVRYAPEIGEIVESPGWVLAHGVADCDGLTWTIGALARSVGLRVRVCLLYVSRHDARDPTRPALVPVHVWPECYDRRGRVWVPLDLALPVPIGTPAHLAAARVGGVRRAPRGM
jgi:transglutaminase-like putative cysteine protease